jgi:hypothetical protein
LQFRAWQSVRVRTYRRRGIAQPPPASPDLRRTLKPIALVCSLPLYYFIFLYYFLLLYYYVTGFPSDGLSVIGLAANVSEYSIRPSECLNRLRYPAFSNSNNAARVASLPSDESSPIR